MRFNSLRHVMILLFLLLVSCNNHTEPSKDQEYETTKQMMVDILQTEDGKKALSEVLNDDAMKQRLVIDSDAVKDALNEQLGSEKGSTIWANYFNDPVFVESFAKSFEKEHLEMLQRAMNDASFQKQMLEMMQDPELISYYLTILKSQSFRAHLEELIEQNFDTPAFQAKIKKIIEQRTKAIEDDDEEEEDDTGADDDTDSEGDNETNNNDNNEEDTDQEN